MKLFATLLFTAFAGTVSAQQYDFTRKPTHNVEAETDNANQSGIERFNIRGHATYIYQYMPSRKSITDSLSSDFGDGESQNTLSATLFAGLRLWKGAELYVNPEITSGMGLSNDIGMASPANGETFHISRPQLSLFLARAYYRQTFALRNKRARKLGYVNSTELESLANQLAGYEPKDYLRFYIGKLSLADIFDRNDFANSSRTQFMNWSLMNNAAWDMAANSRGYTYNFTTEVQVGKMNYKAGIAATPVVARGSVLETDPGKSYSAIAEVRRQIIIRKRPGTIRLLGYYNTGTMGNYAAADSLAQPRVILTRKAGTSKYGFGLNMQQELSNTLSAFMRIGWNNGQTETWSYIEADQSLSIGLSANGSGWKRAGDNLGFAVVVNALSADHKRYIERGGYGRQIGGKLQTYSPEMIGELYYSFRPLKTKLWFTADYQLCLNAGYNSNRSALHMFAIRAHVQF
jgi:high affinity Mn2+ porin